MFPIEGGTGRAKSGRYRGRGEGVEALSAETKIEQDYTWEKKAGLLSLVSVAAHYSNICAF